MNRKSIMLFFVVCLFLLTSISVAAKPLETNGDAGLKTLTGKDMFVGVSQMSVDEQTARNDALLDARRQVISSLGVQVDATTQFTRMMIEDQSGIVASRDQMDIKSVAVAKGVLAVRPERFYVEKWAKAGGKSGDVEYKAWCLVSYSPADHQRTIDKMIGEIFTTGEPLLEKATLQRQTGDVRGAIRTAQSIRDLTAEMNDWTAVPPAQKARLSDLQGRVTALLLDIKLLVAIAEKVDGGMVGSPQFQPRLVSALTSQCAMGLNSSMDWSGVNPDGLLADVNIQKAVAKQMNVDLLLIGCVEVPKVNATKAQYGIYTAKVQGRMKLVDPGTGTVLWEASFPNDLIRDVQSTASNANDAATAALSMKNQKKPAPDQTVFSRLTEGIVAGLR